MLVRSYLWDSFAYDRSPRTISPITAPRVDAFAPVGLFNVAGLFSVALVVARATGKPALAGTVRTRAQPLAGSLPFGVRTFLPRTNTLRGGDRPTCPQLRGARIIANHFQHVQSEGVCCSTFDG